MNRSALRWLYVVPGRKKIYIVFLTIVQAVHGASGVFYALFLRSIVDAAARHDVPGFWRGIVWIVLLVAAQLLLRAIIRWLSELSRSTFENIFKKRLLHTLLNRDFMQVDAIHSGEWQNRLTNDAVVVANGYAEIFPGLAGMVVKLISALVMIVILEPRFAMILIPCGALLVFFTWAFRKVLKKLHKGVQETDGRLRVFLQEHISNMQMIRSYGAEANTERDADSFMQGHKAARMKKNRFSNLCNIGFGSAMNGLYLLGVGWCGYGILVGTISFGTLVAITQLISQIQTPFANITSYIPRYYSMLASAERLMEAEQLLEDEDAVLPLEKVLDFYKNDLAEIGLSDVSFTYYPAARDMEGLKRDEMPVAIEHVDLCIRKGEYVALTGQSGCGKSTQLKLLMCICSPDEGERYYVDRNGNRGDLTSAYRRLFAYVPQGNALMSGTIREVVSFADPDASGDEERLYMALQIACAEKFVRELPQGIDTLLGERGMGLSEGQMQRLAIARAIFSGSPVLLLDEVTSALDAATEKQLLENLRSMTDKTVVIVTHRPAALAICDRR